MKRLNWGRHVAVLVMGEGPFSDFGVEVDIAGFSLGTLVLVIGAGLLSLIMGRFVRTYLLPRFASHFIGDIEESVGVKGSRALSLGISLLLFVEMIDTLDSAIDQMVWDEE